MGVRYKVWQQKNSAHITRSLDLTSLLFENRHFTPIDQLEYGDFGLDAIAREICQAITSNSRIALYADYDVDGTMSCVSWIWFLEALGHKNYVHYIPCRFKEGYGLNMAAVKHLIDDHDADVIITMDTGITANEEAAYCKARGKKFICTDHHKIQPDKMPDCLILNPKLHNDPLYQELCGCGITFVLLRKIASLLPARTIKPTVWNDLLAIAGIATICDIVPLNGVNHKIIKLGMKSLLSSQRPTLRKLLQACRVAENVDEKDVGFRVGPRINAVGRLEHADLVVKAFINDDCDALITHMDLCNERRKKIQEEIVKQARQQASQYSDDPILFLGGDWHPGVVGIAASKLVEDFWKPTWLFQRAEGKCKGSARSIRGFDVTEAMQEGETYFQKFGGHKAAGGFSFEETHLEDLRATLNAYATRMKNENPVIWESTLEYDCTIDSTLVNFDLIDQLDELKPFGHGFEEPRFRINTEVVKTQYYNDKVTGEPKHTAYFIKINSFKTQKVMFFNRVLPQGTNATASVIASVAKNYFNGRMDMTLFGHDIEFY